MQAGHLQEEAVQEGKEKQGHSAQAEGDDLEYMYVDAGWLRISRPGKVHVVFSRKDSQPKILAIATADPCLASEQIVAGYSKRPAIEQSFKDCKQLLGLGDHLESSIPGSRAARKGLGKRFLLTRRGELKRRKKGPGISVRNARNQCLATSRNDRSKEVRTCGLCKALRGPSLKASQ